MFCHSAMVIYHETDLVANVTAAPAKSYDLRMERKSDSYIRHQRTWLLSISELVNIPISYFQGLRSFIYLTSYVLPTQVLATLIHALQELL